MKTSKTRKLKSKVDKPSKGGSDKEAAQLAKKVNLILKEHNFERSSLISILLDIQDEYRYLPKEALKIVADKLGIRFIEIYSVATFYQVFSLKPRGKHLINVCLGTACHVRGGAKIVDKVCKTLDINVGETTTDQKFSLETVRCLGVCALGPVMVVDDDYYERVSTAKVDRILEKYATAED